MAEAITVVGLVAAIIQITKCSKRILDHCKDVNDKSIQVPRSIQSVTIQLPVLNHVLDQVKYHVESNSSHQDPWPALRSLLGACSKEIRHLEGVLSNIIPSSPAKSWNKTSLLMKSLRYDAEVTRTTHNLGQLTHTVHFYLTNETAQSTRMLVANSQKLLQALDQRNQIGRFVTRPSLLREALDSVNHFQVSETDEEIDVDGAMGRSDPRSQASRPDHLMLHSHEIGTPKDSFDIAGMLCHCKRPQIQTSWEQRFLGTTVMSQSEFSHRKGCYLFREEEYVTRLCLQLRGSMLSVAGQISLALRYGAGGMSISPHLEIRGVRRSNSPVFKLLHVFSGCTQGESVPKMIEVGGRIRSLIQSRRVSPYDLDQDGRAVINVVFDELFGGIAYESGITSSYKEHRNRFIKELTLMGFSMNEEPDEGMHGKCTILDRLILQGYYTRAKPSTGFISELIDLGAQFGETARHHNLLGLGPNPYQTFFQSPQLAPQFILVIMKLVEDFADHCGCNSLQIAILQRAKVRFERCLPQDDKSMLERNLLGQTALHLAADWPWACQLLLDAGADYTVTDRLHLLPLSYACQLSCCDTVQMLLAAGSPFLTNDVESTHVLEHAVVANADEELLSFLVQELAHRRRLLLESAKALLPRQKFSAITASMNGLPDTEAPSLVYAINEVGGSADPNYYCCTAYTIYNISYLTTTLAEQLYAAGFQNVTARDSAGFTPLVREVTRTRKVWDPMDPTPMNFPMIMWYFRKGASFLQPTPSKASNSRWVSTVNLVAQEIGQWFELEVHSHLSFEQRLQILPKESMKEVLQLVLGSRFIGSHDFCRCKCSLSGCRPPKMFLKGFGWYRYLQRRTLLRLRLIDWIIEILLATGDPRDSWVFSHSALRLCLFEDLGLRHTCCRITSGGIVPPVDLEEAQEMTEEDTLPRQRFHELYPKIDADWERTTASFSDFYTKILRDHIQQDGNEGMDPAYVKSLEAAGVRILDKDSQSQVLSNDFEEETFTEVGGNSQVIENPTI